MQKSRIQKIILKKYINKIFTLQITKTYDQCTVMKQRFGLKVKKKRDQWSRHRATHVWSCDLQRSRVKKNGLLQ